jgi:hypothetical protein
MIYKIQSQGSWAGLKAQEALREISVLHPGTFIFGSCLVAF